MLNLAIGIIIGALCMFGLLGILAGVLWSAFKHAAAYAIGAKLW